MTGLALADAGTQTPTNDVPALESNPGASARLYLDFDGHYEAAWGDFHDINIPAYDIDGDPSTFSGTEQLNIIDIWRRVAEDYAPFNIDVTTIAPSSFDNATDLRVAIGGDGAWTGGTNGGISYTGLYATTTPHVVFVFPDNLDGGNSRFVAESVSHESGHAFGLDHQSLYDANGNLVDEYNPGDANHAPIMGDSYSARRGVWWNGPTDEGVDDIQDDMAVIGGNSFGWRADEAGDTPDSAEPLAVNNTFVSGSGIIGKMSDVDAWSFETDDGVIMFQVSVPEGINNLDAKVELLDADGNVVVPWQDPSDRYDALLVATVTSGSYRLMVGSHGAYGDVGQYLISGIVVPPGSVLPGPTDLWAQAIGPDQIQLSWTDNAHDETGYQIERTQDGVDWYTIATVDADIAFFTDTGLDAATVYVYRVSAVQGIYDSESSNEASAMTWPALPNFATDLLATAVTSDQIHLTWNDNADNETDYIVEQSKDGVTWLELASLPADSTAYDDFGLTADTTYMYRVRAMNGLTASEDSNLASIATLAATPDAPSGLTATAVATTQINLTWSDNASIETSYLVERSLNGATWETLASLAPGTTAYSSSGLDAATAYYYRVRAVNADVISNASNVALAVTQPNPPPAPTGLKATSVARNMLLLSWADYSSSASSYKVIRSIDGVRWTTIGITAGNARSFKVARPNYGRAYYIAVIGVNAGGNSTPSNVLLARYSSVLRAPINRVFFGSV